MSTPKQCNDRLDDIVALVMGTLAPETARELLDHIVQCDTCRAASEVFMEEEKAVRAGFESLARRLASLEPAAVGSQQGLCLCSGGRPHRFLRLGGWLREPRRWTVAAAAAAVILLAVGLALHVLPFASATPVYALEQTVKANRRVVTYHARITPMKTLGEIWVQLNPDGSLLRARWDMQSPCDGPQTVVFSKGKTRIWFRTRNCCLVVPGQDEYQIIMQARQLFDPRLAFERIHASQAQGKTQIESQEPARPGDPIVLTITSKDNTKHMSKVEIDPATKLVRRMTTCVRHGKQWKPTETIEYLDYNREIDPKVFQLELPKGALIVDQISRKPGLVKGDEMEEQMATRVVREFFEALIARDYDKAGLIVEGLSAERLEKYFGKRKFLRIVRMEKPVWVAKSSPPTFLVLVTMEYEIDGQRKTEVFSPCVRPAFHQPERRVICGGV
jgi:hypothetical protein